MKECLKQIPGLDEVSKRESDQQPKPVKKVDFDTLYRNLDRTPLVDKVYGEWEV